jgi:hypothetical protein
VGIYPIPIGLEPGRHNAQYLMDQQEIHEPAALSLPSMHGRCLVRLDLVVALKNPLAYPSLRRGGRNRCVGARATIPKEGIISNAALPNMEIREGLRLSLQGTDGYLCVFTQDSIHLPKRLRYEDPKHSAQTGSPVADVDSFAG